MPRPALSASHLSGRLPARITSIALVPYLGCNPARRGLLGRSCPSMKDGNDSEANTQNQSISLHNVHLKLRLEILIVFLKISHSPLSTLPRKTQ